MRKTSFSPKRQSGSTPVIVVIVIVLAIIVFAATQIFPLYWDHWNFEESVSTAIKLELVPPYEEIEQQATQKIISLLDTMGAVYDENNILVKADPNVKKIQVEVWYSLPHHLPLYPNPKPFYIKVEQKAIISVIKEKLKLPTPRQLP